jgi:putative PIN family toxin of toxin-antitoxin system
MTPRVVFDCMVFLQGAGKPRGPSGRCLHLVDEGHVTLCVSGEILAEVRDVLTRPDIQRRFPGITSEWVETFVDDIRSKAVVFDDVPNAVPLPRDPKDEAYVNLAVAAAASYLVSHDRDLLDLMTDEEFCRRYQALAILEPVSFLHEVDRLRNEAQTSEGEE